MKKLSIAIVIIAIFVLGFILNKERTIDITKAIDLSKSEFTSIQIVNVNSGKMKFTLDKYLIDELITNLSHYKIKKLKGNTKYNGWDYELQIGGTPNIIHLSDNNYIEINFDMYEIVDYKIDLETFFNSIKE
jgi:hypothetical protein